MSHSARKRRMQCGWLLLLGTQARLLASQVPLDLVPPKSLATDFKDVCERLGESILRIRGRRN